MDERPSKTFPFDSKYDFAYRPATYWPDLPTEETVLAQVKGTVRRNVARSLLDEPDETAPEGVGDFLLTSDLGEGGKEFWGSFHPSHLGGEFLPDSDHDEVAIARIELASVTGDVYEVRARRGSDGRIHYGVVDEYWDEGSRFDVRPEASEEPLTLGQLIELIDTARQAHEPHRHPDETYNVGLFDMDRQFNYDESGEAEMLVHFAVASSPFYPMLGEYFSERAEAWLQETEKREEEAE